MSLFWLFVFYCLFCVYFNSAQAQTAIAHQMVYKTRHDYSKLVSVELSPDKKKVVSYPRPADPILIKSPLALKDGYWISNSILTINTAFLAITFADYRRLVHAAPTASDLLFLVKDRSPFVELWDCGTVGTLSTAQLNLLIEQKKLKDKFQKLN